MGREQVLARLRNASAQGRLVIISGAGISCKLLRPNGTPLPNWKKLVEELRAEADENRLSRAERRQLDDLLPPGRLNLHGDALIEASEILRGGFDEGDFEKKIASLCREKTGQTSDTHKAIASAAPAGIITFNYDRAHETAFRKQALPLKSILYSDDERIKSLLAQRRSGPPFLLKAHGSVSHPESLVLTSSSYRKVLSSYRPYRTFLQYVLLHYTVLIVGFALRDRDFDLLLSTLEVELGKPEQRHVFIAERPAADPAGQEQGAAWAALTRRFGVDPLYVDDFAEIPQLIRSVAERPGPLIRSLVAKARSSAKSVRTSVHDEIKMLDQVGRRQLRAALIAAIDRAAADPQTKSELIYALGGVADGEPAVAARLVAEVSRAASDFSARPDRQLAECAAHALLVLRRSRLEDPVERARLLGQLDSPALHRQLKAMDAHLKGMGEVPRILAYAVAASAEIEARARA